MADTRAILKFVTNLNLTYLNKAAIIEIFLQ